MDSGSVVNFGLAQMDLHICGESIFYTKDRKEPSLWRCMFQVFIVAGPIASFKPRGSLNRTKFCFVELLLSSGKNRIVTLLGKGN